MTEPAVAAAAPVTEVPPAPPEGQPPAMPPEPKKDNAALFAALAKKEKAIRAERESIKAKAAELEKQRAEITDLLSLKTTAKQDPLSVLKTLGITYEELTQRILNDGRPAPDAEVKQLRDEVRQWQEKQEAERQRQLEEEKGRVAEEQKAAVDRFRGEVTSFVSSNAEKYELLNLYGQQGLVSEVIAQHYSATQRVMDTAEAADRAEKYLEELVQKAASTKKFAAKVAPQEAKPAQQVAQPRTNTLSNDLSASAPSMVNQPQSEADRIKRALAALDRAGK